LKTGLKLEGKRSAVLDAGDDGSASPNTGHAIEIHADGVRLEGFSIRGGNLSHVLLGLSIDGVRVEDVASSSSGQGFVESISTGNDDTRIEDCEVTAFAGTAVRIRGDRTRIKSNRFVDGGSDALRLTGDDAVIEKNDVENMEGSGIDAEGHGVEVAKNEIIGTNGLALHVMGNDAFVSKNSVSLAGAGIYLSGNDPVAEKNEVAGIYTDSIGLSLDCSPSCTGARAIKNEVKNSLYLSTGLSLYAAHPGLRVEKNKAERAGRVGLFTRAGGGAVIRKNRVKQSGSFGDGTCFYVSGSEGRVEENEASGCANNAISVRGYGHVLEENRVTRAGANGYHVLQDSDEVRLEENRAKDAAIAGFRIDDGTNPANETELIENKSSGKRRFDLCDEGIATLSTGNDFNEVLLPGQNGTQECPGY